MLIAKGITKSYDDLQILKGINLEIKEGEVVSIVGSSGAGKTTLLQILGTLDRPDRGEVLMNGVNPFNLSANKLSAFRNTQIGFIFQFHQLLPEFTAVENIALPALIKGINLKDAKTEAMKLLGLLGLENRAEHKPSQLSGGEQQRIAVARSLINRPGVIFADEPSGNLDSQNSSELHQLFFNLRDELNQTFVIVTHNNELADMTDRKLVMRDGLIIE
ncbi:ABC transporter ATP-binding protein [Crocinitomicaceae bacterium]|jgi:lipoprotein-releasing system ATP-binding protein|nr:ABC transporter ATP-binding protein [Crocinitomicaceae bacterium]MDB4075670.1 ABC transporter ATP-binding protein [Crocinitomicaceae bacterium]MDC1282812.1 ABC transporter ATP-binding protein [Crocinitomicaceae bacterium]MDC1384653.1 ABC transporter ATP-binding protein [Crocinitomicaceae bacterium]|tara:strand:+ start:5892 stop:6545 length:654 start_codon:yes stop_codon:yes gene_type:complete